MVADERSVSSQIIAGRGNRQPIRILFQRGKKIRKPSALVTVFVRSGPDTELFHVVAHGRHAPRVQVGSIAQISDDVFDFAKWNEIAQSFLPGVKPPGFATLFGNVGAK